MINKNQKIRMTAIEYVPQFHGGASRYYRADFYTSTVLVEKCSATNMLEMIIRVC